MASCSVRADVAATSQAPTTVPGRRPARAHGRPRESTAPRSRQQASALSGRFTSSSGTGTKAGSTSVSSGAETSAMPKPMVPWAAAAPTAITVARTSSSAPSTPVAAGSPR